MVHKEPRHAERWLLKVVAVDDFADELSYAFLVFLDPGGGRPVLMRNEQEVDTESGGVVLEEETPDNLTG